MKKNDSLYREKEITEKSVIDCYRKKTKIYDIMICDISFIFVAIAFIIDGTLGLFLFIFGMMSCLVGVFLSFLETKKIDEFYNKQYKI